MTASPTLGLALRGPADDLRPLLTALSRWCSPRSLVDGELAAAVLADDLLEPAPTMPYVIASRDPAVLAMAGANGMYPPDGASSGDARGVPPFVRERLRRRRGVPAAVLGPDLHWPGRGQLSGELAETAFAVAVAVVAHNVRDATLALAWGTPLVCDAVTALRLGIEDGVHALVDGDPQAIWTDSALAASLSRNGRRKWETEHDAVRAAAELAVRLLPAAENSLIRHAASLGTPPTAAIFDRVADFGLG